MSSPAAADRVFPDTIAAPVTHEFVERKSRFIAQIAPVGDVAEAETVIAAIRKRAWDARHNCSAIVTGVLGDHARSSDDGEPAGTAGVPMLEVLRKRALTDVVAVVTRYFGDIKLGAGGLVRAYSSAVGEALDIATIVHRRELRHATVEVPHTDAGRIDNLLRDWVVAHGATLGEPSYGAAARFSVWVPPAESSRLTDDLAAATSGRIIAEFGESRVVDVPASPR